MTDTELKAQLASVQTSLRHLEKGLSDLRSDHKEGRSQITGLFERMVRIEENERALMGLPRKVNDNERVSAVQDAIRDARQDAFAETRRLVFAGIAAAGTIASILTIIIDRMWGA